MDDIGEGIRWNQSTFSFMERAGGKTDRKSVV